MPRLEEFKITNTYLELPHGDDFDFGDKPFTRRNGLIFHFERAMIAYPFGDIDDDDDNNSNDGDGEDRELDLIIVNNHIEARDENGNVAAIDGVDGDNHDDNEMDMGWSSDSENEGDAENDSDSESDNEFDLDFLGFELYPPSVAQWKQIYTGLSRMPCLKKLWLRSYFDSCIDLVDVLNTLARNGTINELTIQNQAIDFRAPRPVKSGNVFTNFASLKSFRFIAPSVRALPFLEQFVAAMPNTSKFIVDADEESVNVSDTIITIVERAPNAEMLVLKMPPSYFTHMLYIKLKRIQQAKHGMSKTTKPLQVYISSLRQKRVCRIHLGSQYDEKIIAINARSFTDWCENPL